MVSIFDIFRPIPCLVTDLYSGITQRSYNQTVDVEQWERSGLGPRLKFEVSLRLFSGCCFSSVVTTTNRPACHVKINWQSSGGPPFYPSTCGVISLPAGPYLTISPNVFGLFSSLSAQIIMAKARRWKSFPKMAAHKYKDVTSPHTWPRTKTTGTGGSLGARPWSRDVSEWAYLSAWREMFLKPRPGRRWSGLGATRSAPFTDQNNCILCLHHQTTVCLIFNT